MLRRALDDPSIDRIEPHITLVPPVNVREDDVPAAVALLRDAAASTATFELTLGPAASFLPVNPVVYLEVGGAVDRLLRLRGAVFTSPLERELTWPFVPHVTIADDADPARVEAAVTTLAGYEAVIDVERIAILEEGEGRVWSTMADAVLGPRRVVGRGGLPLEITEGEVLDPEAAAFSDRAWRRMDDERAVDGVLAREEAFTLAARRDGIVVGVADGFTAGRAAYLAHLIVDEDLRGEGVGAHLLAAFQSLAAERGCDHATLRTREGGPAQRFYERAGWVVAGRLPEYRWGDDFVVMRRRL